jgi:hypothetical protein
MRKIIYSLCLLIATAGFAQEKYAPVIKQGTVLHYTVFAQGQNIASTFSFDSVAANCIKVGWNIDGLGTGSWLMKNKSLDNGTKGYWSQPTPGMQEELGDDQTVLVFSHAQWASLQKDQKVNFDQQTYTVKKPSDQQLLKLSDKPVDAFYLESQNSSSRIWILNNPSFPILLKIEGNTVGPDIAINSVE